MSRALWIACYESIQSTEILKKYAESATVAINKYNGKFLVRGIPKLTLEGSSFLRTVVVQFENADDAQRCYESKEYQAAFNILKGSVKRNLQIIEGI